MARISILRNISASIALIVIATAGAFAATYGHPNKSAPAATTAPSTVTVEIDNFHFKPQDLTISVGTTVTWVNNDDVPHTATAKGDNPLFDSKALDTDDKFSFTFTKAGTYPYYCKVHPHMTGTIIVQ